MSSERSVATTPWTVGISQSTRRRAAWWRLGSVEIVAALTALGAALRFATINLQSMERDEASTMILVRHGFSGMLSHLPTSESAPPLYYVLVWAWTHVFGSGPVGFRSFSALVGTLCIPVFYAAGRHVSTRVGVWAAALAAVSPWMFFYSQQARSYELMVLFSVAAFAFWERALETPTGRRLALWSGMSILAVLTHYFAAFLFIPEALVLMRRLGWRRVWPAIGAVVVVGLALVPLANSQRSTGSTNWIGETSLASRFTATVKEFLVGAGPMENLWAGLAGLLALGAIALLLRGGDRRERSAARDAGIVAIVAIAVPLLLAASHLEDVYNARNVIAVWVPLAILVAIGLGTARTPRLGTLLGVGLCAISLGMLIATSAMTAYHREDWRGVAKVLNRPGDGGVIVGEEFAFPPLSIYMQGLRHISSKTVSTDAVDVVEVHDWQTTATPLTRAGFHYAGAVKTSTYTVYRFTAPKAETVAATTLRSIGTDPKVEIILRG